MVSFAPALPPTLPGAPRSTSMWPRTTLRSASTLVVPASGGAAATSVDPIERGVTEAAATAGGGEGGELPAQPTTTTTSHAGATTPARFIACRQPRAAYFLVTSAHLLLWSRVRAWNVQVHRRLGQAYLVLVVLSGGCAVFLSLTTAYAVNGPYAFSLQIWAGVWLTSSFVAYRAARARKLKVHKEWMTRSYLVLLAFVAGALLVKVPAVGRLGTFAEISPSIFWFCWAVPLYLYDLYLASPARSAAPRDQPALALATGNPPSSRPR